MAFFVAVPGSIFSSIVGGLVLVIVLGTIKVAIDHRTSRRHQQAADREAQLQTIFDHLTEGVVVLSREGTIAQINRTAASLFGLKERTSSLETALDSFEISGVQGEPVTPDQRPLLRALHGEFFRNEEYRLHAKNSDRAIVCNVSAAPVANRAGQIVQAIVSFRDVTERKQYDEARNRLAAIVESSEDAIIGKDLHSIVTTWNRGAEKIFGYTAEEIVGQSIRCLLPPGHEFEEDRILERIRHGETVDHFETLRRKKDGQLFHASLTISPIRNTSGEIVGASKIARDITDRKQMERQMRQSQKMEAIGQLTGGIAHDFNNLLGIIVGNLDLLERSLRDNDVAQRRVQTAQKAAARGADLTRRLLSFSSREELNPTSIALDESVQNMIELASHAIGPEIVVVTHFDKTVPPVFVDPSALESALLNLVVNARDAMPKGGSITISTKMRELEASYPPVVTGEIAAGMYACVSVSDSGHGMSPETLERAFEPFFSTKPRGKGTGLGLAMVYGFVRQSKGTVRLYSEVGYGTTVSLYLPLANEPVPPVKPHAKPVSTSNGNEKILVVDDEAALLDIAAAYLEEMGYTALQAEDAITALEIFSQHPDIELILTDIIMPGGVNGVELAQKIRVLNPATKVIFTSGFPSDALAERSGNKVDGPLLQKPYQRVEFMSMIRRVMEGAAGPPPKGPTAQPESNESAV